MKKIAAMFRAIEAYFERLEQRSREEALAGSSSIQELEARMRQLERPASFFGR